MSAYMKDRVWIPITAVNMKKVRAKYTHSLFEDNACQRCEYKVDRPDHPTEESICYSCENYTGTYRLFRRRETEDGQFVGLPIGDIDTIEKDYDLEALELEDLRSSPKFKHPIKFLGKLRDYQEPAVAAMVKAGSGVLEAPPRSGKTVMGSALAIRIGKKTLIMASQQDWLDQFYETLCGGAMMDAITNIPQLEAKLGYKICGVARKQEDFEQFDIALTTYQMFMETYGRKRMRWIRRKFGTVIVDECLPGDAQVVLDHDGSWAYIKDMFANPEKYPHVLSRNDATGQNEIKPWKPYKESRRADFIDIEYEGGTFTCTPEHRIWSNDRKDYVYACDLKEGEDIELLGKP